MTTVSALSEGFGSDGRLNNVNSAVSQSDSDDASSSVVSEHRSDGLINDFWPRS